MTTAAAPSANSKLAAIWSIWSVYWKCKADSDSDAACATRISFLERYAELPTLVIGTHFAAPTAGRIVRDGDAFRFEV